MPQVTQVMAAWLAQPWSQTVLQQVGSMAHTELQQSESEQYGPVCASKQLRTVPSAAFSPQPAPVVEQDGLRRKGVSLVSLMASVPLVRVSAVRQR